MPRSHRGKIFPGYLPRRGAQLTIWPDRLFRVHLNLRCRALPRRTLAAWFDLPGWSVNVRLPTVQVVTPLRAFLHFMGSPLVT